MDNLKFHHIGYAVYDISLTAEYYIKTGWALSEIQVDKIQNSKIAFLAKKDFPLIELIVPHLSPPHPLKKKSPLPQKQSRAPSNLQIKMEILLL